MRPIITRRRDDLRGARPTAARLGTNFFGILEPDRARRIDPRRLDLVLTPLVAFDDRGVRIGVGRGYYDRCFKFLHARERVAAAEAARCRLRAPARARDRARAVGRAALGSRHGGPGAPLPARG